MLNELDRKIRAYKIAYRRHIFKYRRYTGILGHEEIILREMEIGLHLTRKELSALKHGVERDTWKKVKRQ